MSVGGRHFAFYSNDKDGLVTKQQSELFEWVGTFPTGRLGSRQRVATDGAHVRRAASRAVAGASNPSHPLTAAPAPVVAGR